MGCLSSGGDKWWGGTHSGVPFRFGGGLGGGGHGEPKGVGGEGYIFLGVGRGGNSGVPFGVLGGGREGEDDT